MISPALQSCSRSCTSILGELLLTCLVSHRIAPGEFLSGGLLVQAPFSPVPRCRRKRLRKQILNCFHSCYRRQGYLLGWSGQQLGQRERRLSVPHTDHLHRLVKYLRKYLTSRQPRQDFPEILIPVRPALEVALLLRQMDLGQPNLGFSGVRSLKRQGAESALGSSAWTALRATKL